MSAPSDGSGWRRLHPAVLLLEVGSTLRRLLLPLVLGALAVSRREGGPGTFVAVASAISGIGLLSRYLSFRYRLTPDGIEVHEGLVTRRHRTILRSRISHSDTQQSAVARMLGVLRLDIETEGGSGPGASFSALSVEAADEIRSHIGRLGPAREAERRIYAASLRDRIVAGATTLQVGAAVAVVLVGARVLRRLEPGAPDDPGAASRWLPGAAERALEPVVDVIAGSTLALVLAVAAATLTIWAFSIGLALVRWHGFAIAERGAALLMQAGVWSREVKVIERGRVQAVEVRASPVRRLLGLGQISIVSMGAERTRERTTSRVFVPITPLAKAAGLVAELLPAAVEVEGWRAVDPHHLRQTIVRGLLLGAAVVGVALAILPLAILPLGWGTVGLGVGFVAWVEATRRLAKRSFARTGYALRAEVLHVRRVGLGMTHWIVPIARVQGVVLRQSVFQRRRGVVDVEIDLNGLSAYQHVAIPCVPEAEAQTLRGSLTPGVDAHEVVVDDAAALAPA